MNFDDDFEMPILEEEEPGFGLDVAETAKNAFANAEAFPHVPTFGDAGPSNGNEDGLDESFFEEGADFDNLDLLYEQDKEEEVKEEPEEDEGEEEPEEVEDEGEEGSEDEESDDYEGNEEESDEDYEGDDEDLSDEDISDEDIDDADLIDDEDSDVIDLADAMEAEEDTDEGGDESIADAEAEDGATVDDDGTFGSLDMIPEPEDDNLVDLEIE